MSPLDIALFTGETDRLDLELYDTQGRSVWRTIAPVERDIYTHLRINADALRDLDSGCYLLRASLGGRAELVRQVIKAP